MKTLKSSEGFALLIAILVMAVVMLFIGASLLLSRVDTKITSNFKLGTQALEVADAGLMHALKVLEPQKGWDFNDPNCSLPCNLFSSESFPSAPGFTYSVTVDNDPADSDPTDDTDNLVVLVSTANGPNDTKRTVQAYVNRSLVDFTSPGALYLPASSIDVDFSKANNPGMFITGDDTSYTDSDSDGWADSTSAGPALSVKGVAVINSGAKTDFLLGLGVSNFNLVQGAEYSESPSIVPSVSITTDIFDVNQIAVNFFNNASSVKYLEGLKLNCSSPCTLGTDASPQITYLREDGKDHIHLDGLVTGSGVLITEGRTHLYGDFEFHGIVVNVNIGTTGGETHPEGTDPEPLVLKDNAKIFGSILIGPTNGEQSITVKDDAKIYFNSEAIDMAESLCGECFPQPPSVSAWIDK